MPCLLNLEHLNRGRPFLPSNPPNAVANYRSPQNWFLLIESWNPCKANLQSSNADVKLIHIFPSQVPFPRLLTVPAIEAVSISSILFKMPSGVRNPTIILGTPSRKDCIQNFMSLRSKVIISLSLRMSALVFNSTQFMGLPSVGLESQTWPISEAQYRAEEFSYLHRLHHQGSSQYCQYQSSQPNNIGRGCWQSRSLDFRCNPVKFRPI